VVAVQQLRLDGAWVCGEYCGLCLDETLGLTQVGSALFVMFLWDFIVNDVLLELWMAIGYMQ
jgi:hypothetical protein